MIKKQDDLVLSLSSSNASLRQENNDLSNALVKFKDIDNGAVQRELTYGALGAAAGVILTIIVTGKH